MTRVSSLSIAIGMLIALGCGADNSATGVSNERSSFSVSTTGDRRDSIGGFTFTQFMPAGWSEVSNGGATRYVSDVTLLSLASLDLTKPTVGLGLLGSARAETYQVRVVGTSVDARPQFYASYSVPNADGSRVVYAATSGIVVVTSVSNGVIKGTFTFHAGQSTTWPANIAPGTTVSSVPASLDASGSFVARAP
ncbi:MAG TPA: hypothetical protein VN706_15710 [Gemmatimonadaceae bacterium]|nr:hypothetical protein [Gemmatimonadaceae bacterium]